MSREIKVKIEGKITEYNIKLYHERVAITLIKELGKERCLKLLELLNEKEEWNDY